MKYPLLTILLLVIGNGIYAQNKVKVQLEYDMQYNPKKSGKLKSELVKKYYFDEAGFMNEIISYGKKKMIIDTIIIKQQDGSEIVTTSAKWPEDMKQIGRVEKFIQKEDHTLFGVGYEIWNKQDTFRFENKYTLESPGVYMVNSTSKIPNASSTYFCDLQFNMLYNETKSFREYNDDGQITSKHYLEDNQQGMIKRGMVKHFKYDANGSLVQDSIIHQGSVILNNRYFYDNLNRLIRQEQMITRFNRQEQNTIVFEYDKNGLLHKKGQKMDWATVYQYLYY